MSEHTVTFERRDAVTIITINRPEAMNSFNAQLRVDLLAALERAGGDDAARVIILTGAGRSFSVGADLNSLSSEKPLEQTLQSEYRPILKCITEMRQPVIGVVSGSAAGIGMSYALACDLLIMAEDAFLVSPFTAISLIPDGGLSWFLVHQVGYRRALQLSIESVRIPASRCVELGIANRVVPSESLMHEALEWAEALAERAPLSVAATKKVMRFATENSLGSTYDMEAELQQALYETEDHKEGVSAFFNKRKPTFQGK
jgi:2-(1,2-epoxy-1,2-dihydrophenyl)acetyl-CoA isomerase